MRNSCLAWTLLIVTAIAGSPCFADSPGEKSLDCLVEVKLDKELVEGIRDSGQFLGQKLRGRRYVLIGTTAKPGGNVYLFERRREHWSAYLVAEGSSALGAYASRNGAVYAWSMHDEEGPGNAFDGLFFRGRQSGCLTLPFPSELNKPDWRNEYLQLIDFNIKRDNDGLLVARAELEREGKQVFWNYIYTIHSNGAAVGGPHKLSTPPRPKGIYRKFDGRKSAGEINSLIEASH